MKIYGISGLGADKRVFDYLTLDYELVPIEWIDPLKNESIEDYSLRLSRAIDTNSEFAILGVSFGGLVAVEISKITRPNLTILVSSAETKNQIRPILIRLGKTGILKFLPKIAFKPPKKIAKIVFGTEKKELLNNILDDTDLEFAKWAINELINWNNEEKLKHVLRIHGSKDKLIPWNSKAPVELIKDGTHFMIVDRAKEISKIINDKIKTYHNNG